MYLVSCLVPVMIRADHFPQRQASRYTLKNEKSFRKGDKYFTRQQSG